MASFTTEFFRSLVPDYTVSIYPIIPIVFESELQALIDKMNSDQEERALVYALGAMTLNITRYGPKHNRATSAQTTALFTQALEMRGPVMPNERITVQSIMIPLFAANCILESRVNLDMAFYYLREAITRLQLLKVENSGDLEAFPVAERARRQRLYWLLFIHERFQTISYYRPSILPPLRTLPEYDPQRPQVTQEYFYQMIALWRIIDADFIENWLDRTRDSAVTFTWIEKKQAELGEGLDLPNLELQKLTETQQADLIVTRHWLRAVVWQMALSKFLLISDLSRDSMSIFFPVRLSRRLRELVTRMSREAVEIHGTGILQKIFDITNTLADILINIPAITTEEMADRVDDFLFLFRFLLGMARFNPVEKQILQAKLETLQERAPYVCAQVASSMSMITSY